MITLADIDTVGSVKFNLLCASDKLGDDVIYKYFDKFDKDVLCICQELSGDIIDCFFKELTTYESFYKYQKIPYHLFDKYYNMINWVHFSKSPYINLYLFNKYNKSIYLDDVIIYSQLHPYHFSKYKYRINFARLLNKLEVKDVSSVRYYYGRMYISSDVFKLRVDKLETVFNI